MASTDDLWIVDFGDPYPGEPGAHRPALVIGPPDIFGPGLPFVIVSPLTTARRELSLHVEVEATDRTGLTTTSYIQCELIRSINARRLVRQIGAIEVDTSMQVAQVTATLLGL